MNLDYTQLSNHYLLTKIVCAFKQRITHIVQNDLGGFVLFLFFLCVFSCLSLLGGGFQLNTTSIVFVFIVFLLPLFIFNYQVFRYLVLIHGVISILYFPVGRIWGRVNNNIISSLIGTNLSESKDFFSLIPYKYFIGQFVFIIIIYLLLKTAKYIKIFNKKQKEIISIMYVCMYVLVYVCMYISYCYVSNFLDIEFLLEWVEIFFYPYLFFVFILFIIIIGYFEYKKLSEKIVLSVLYVVICCSLAIYSCFIFSVYSMKLIPYSFIYHDTYYAWQDYRSNQLARIKADSQNKWELSEPYVPKYKNYVLVIGESLRQDYMSVYGYPLKTTPFLDDVNGVFIDAYYSTAGYTDNSLMHSLYWKPDDKMADNSDIFFGNIIQLAKKAGLKTHWISNNNSGWTAQITPLANQSDYVDLKGELLVKLSDVLQKPRNNQANLFVIHLYGQHEPYCEKLKNTPQFSINIGDIDCYLQSIYEDDQRLKQLTEILNKYGSYSIMFFSDHALTSSKNGSQKRSTTLRHAIYDKDYRQSFLVPLFQISSDSTEHKIIKTQKSGFNFIYAFTEWLNIKERHLNPNYCFWCEEIDENIQVLVYRKVDGHKHLHYDGDTVPLSQLLEDPPIVPNNIQMK